jgi:hypothetical protein
MNEAAILAVSAVGLTPRNGSSSDSLSFDRTSLNGTRWGGAASGGIERTIKIESIAVHYDLAIPPEHREAAERALRVHPEGCPARQSVKDAIAITWDARLRVGDEVLELRETG